jgi:1-acyl-sn-glycerol-3-phosphate acyltransferase
LSETFPLVLKLPVCVLVTMLLLILTWIYQPLDRQGAWLKSWTVFWARTMLWICRVRVKTEGLAQLGASQQYVFVSNHASWIDIPVLIASLPYSLTFIAKRELFKMRLVGACLRRTGQIGLDRANTRGYAEGLKKAAESLTRNHRSVVFFPAGTRVSSGVGRFKDGAAYFAIRARLPVVPVALAGTGRAMPRGAMRIWGGTVQLRVGNPIATTDLEVTARAKLTEQLQAEVLSMVMEYPVQTLPGASCLSADSA